LKEKKEKGEWHDMPKGLLI